jgi:hypothetical protein
MSSRRERRSTATNPRTRSPWDWFEQRTSRLVFVAGAVTTLLGVPSAVYGVYKLFHQEHAPIHLGLTIGQRARLNQPWSAAHGRLAARSGTHPDPGHCGVVFAARLRVVGLSGESATLSWTPRSASSDAVLGVPSWVPLSLVLRKDTETTESIWVPVPGATEKFRVDFRLAAKGRKVEASSPDVRVLQLPEEAPATSCLLR